MQMARKDVSGTWSMFAVVDIQVIACTVLPTIRYMWKSPLPAPALLLDVL